MFYLQLELDTYLKVMEVINKNNVHTTLYKSHSELLSINALGFYQWFHFG